MKALRAFMLLLAALLVCAPAAAESQGDTLDPEAILDAVDISELEKASQQQGVDAKAMILSLATGESAWDLSALLEALRKDALEALTQAMAMVAALLAPALLSALARQLAGEARGAQVVSQLAYLVCAAQLAGWFVRLGEQAGALIAQVSDLADGVFPLLASLLSLTGATASAAMVTPLSALAGNVFSRLLSQVGLKMCAAASALAVACHLSPKVRLERLFSLIRSVVNWATGVLMTGFLGLSAVRSLLSAGHDSAAVRTARYAVDNLLPVVGGEVANTMDALVSSVLLVKNAAGVTGLFVLALVCARPLMTLAAALVALRLISAMLEPVAEDALISLADKFSQVAGMLLVISASAAVIFTLLLGGTLTAGQSVVR